MANTYPLHPNATYRYRISAVQIDLRNYDLYDRGTASVRVLPLPSGNLEDGDVCEPAISLFAAS